MNRRESLLTMLGSSIAALCPLWLKPGGIPPGVEIKILEGPFSEVKSKRLAPGAAWYYCEYDLKLIPALTAPVLIARVSFPKGTECRKRKGRYFLYDSVSKVLCGELTVTYAEPPRVIADDVLVRCWHILSVEDENG